MAGVDEVDLCALAGGCRRVPDKVEVSIKIEWRMGER